jgi:integrase
MQVPKTKTSLRTLDLPSFVVEALREHEARAKVEGTLLNDRLLVFTDTAGHPLRRSNVRRRSFEALLKTAQVSHCRLHDLRHTCATLALKAGVPPHVVSKMLGHARVSITMDVYAHCLPGQGKEAARAMDAVFTAANPV